MLEAAVGEWAVVASRLPSPLCVSCAGLRLFDAFDGALQKSEFLGKGQSIAACARQGIFGFTEPFIFIAGL